MNEEKNQLIEDDPMVREFFTCECDSLEHTVSFVYFIENDGTIEIDGLYFEISLNSRFTFWGRVKAAIKYIFGYECRYGHWDAVTMKRRDAERLRDLMNKYINSGKVISKPRVEIKDNHNDIGC